MGAGSCLSSSSEVSTEDRVSEVGEDGSTDRLQEAVRTLILGLGEDPTREGLRDTPKVCSRRPCSAPARPGPQWLRRAGARSGLPRLGWMRLLATIRM